MNNRSGQNYFFGEFSIDLRERELKRNGQAIPLTLKAFDVLLLLVENAGHILNKNDLLDAVWPDSFVEESVLARNISTIRQAINDNKENPRYIETIARRGYRFIAPVRATIADEPATPHPAASGEIANRARLITPNEKIETVGGAVPLDSNFYIVRPVDEKFHAALARQDSIVLIKGARQMGKTSLLARGLQQARDAGARVIFTDLQILSERELQSPETFFIGLINTISEQLELDYSPRSNWDMDNSPIVNFGRFIKREVLQKIGAPLVWGLDEVDRLFNCYFSNEVFSLFRSWHNMRSLDPHGPWQQLTLVIAYATEAHLLITDVNQSPFNVGTQLFLEDLSFQQIEQLHNYYGMPLSNGEDLRRFYQLVNGHPYLVRKGFYELVQGMSLAKLEATADKDEGPFGSHLRHIYAMLLKDPVLLEVLNEILAGQPCRNAESFYRLRSAGLISGESTQSARLRCPIYFSYLKQRSERY